MENLNENQKERIIGILSELSAVPTEQITEDTKVKDGLGMDSLDLVEVVMRLENEFGCTIPDDDYGLETTLNVGDLFKIVANRI
jgi:acyl carrier protein